MMIRAEELRKGNLFLCQLEVDKGEEVCKVEWITKNGIGNQTGGICPYSASNPIPLTPELLMNCGFNPFIGGTIDDNRYFIQIGNNLYLNYYIRSESWCVEPEAWNNEQTCWLQPKFLHQLQNLFFTLTGEELNVKL